MLNVKNIIGLTKDEATKYIINSGFKQRIMQEDGKEFVGTCDFRRDRVNLNIENGVVIKARIG